MNLLHQFSWGAFGVAALIVLLVWYLVVWAVYYAKHPSQDEPERKTLFRVEEVPGVLGAAEEPEGSSVVPMEGFSFADRGEDELRGLVPDVLEEIKQVLVTVESKGGDKADFIALFRLVSAKYERLKTSRHIGAVHDWIMDNVPFEFTEDELWSLWD